MTDETAVKSKPREPENVSHEPGTDREEMMDNDPASQGSAKTRAAETTKPGPLGDDAGKPTPAERHRRSGEVAREGGIMVDAADCDTTSRRTERPKAPNTAT